MKKIYGKRIIALTITFLILISFTSLGYKIGFDNRIYASEQIIQQEAAKLAPVVAWLALNYDRAEQTVENLSGYIDSAKQTFNKAYQTLSATTKVINAMIFTDYSLEEINAVYGTSYSESKVTALGINELRLKIANGEPLTEYDMHLLGIDKLLAEEIKGNKAGNSIRDGEIYTYNDIGAKHMTISGVNYWVKSFIPDDMVINTLPFQFKATQSIEDKKSGAYQAYMTADSTIYMNHNENYFKITLKYLYDDPSKTTVSRETAKVLGTYRPKNIDGELKLFEMIDGIWVSIYSTTNVYDNTNSGLFNAISTATDVDITTNQRYGELIWKSFPTTWVGNNVSFGNSDLLYTVYTPTADVFGEFTGADTNIDAEALIGNVAAQGADTNEIEIGVTGYENADTGEPEIVVIPTGTTGVDTGADGLDIPDTSGDTSINEDGTGMLNIPILGTILKWLQRIWQMAKDIYDLVLNHFQNPASTDSGTDWGNFTNFFDIFWIFYYLIIIAILILLKFFSVIMTMLSIPANTALFEQYPTMLSGLNYIKNIKVGGFNVTLQTIFEYMFTVFFFAYIVITLQKLYHSITGIERQAARENKDIKIDTNDINKQYTEYSSFNKDLYNKEIYGNDKSVDNIKLTGWGDK